jgi:hypothetical protein
MFSLTLYSDGTTDNPRPCGGSHPHPAPVTGQGQVNSEDDDDVPQDRQPATHDAGTPGLQTPEQPEHPVELPAQTANPKRTVLMEIPVAAAATAE